MANASSLPPNFNRGVVTTVHQGDCHVSDMDDVTFSTVLGSCISACVRDVSAGVGGMNHFLLANKAGGSEQTGALTRYGAFAMEQLINNVWTRGSGRKSNLEIKVFGGGLISATLQDVGAKNIEFVKTFLKDEGYAIAGEDVGGTYARRVMYKPTTGRAFVKRLDSTAAAASLVAREVELAAKQVQVKPEAEDIELF